MKRALCIIMIFLAACAAQKPPAPSPTGITNITLAATIDAFKQFDTELNTSWHDEKVPEHLINPRSIKPWAVHLENLSHSADEPSKSLIAARLAMLKSQTAYYLGAKADPTLEIVEVGKEYKIANLDCNNATTVEKAITLYYASYKQWAHFVGVMDGLMQNNVEARELIGVNDKQPAFYKSSFPNAEVKVRAVLKQLQSECGLAITLPSAPGAPQAPQSVGASI